VAYIKANASLSWTFAVAMIGFLLLNAVSCRAPRSRPSAPTEVLSVPAQTSYGVVPAARWQERQFPEVRTSIPQIAGAEYVNDDQLCATCHEPYVKHHLANIHFAQSCEACHGPGSEHLRTRGREPGLIRNFKRMLPAERSETCLQCHEQNACGPGANWRVSAHANAGVSCTDCHTSHYNVSPAERAAAVANEASLEQAGSVRLTSASEAAPAFGGAGSETPNRDAAAMAALRAESRRLGALTPQVCYRCHAGMSNQQQTASAHQICGAAGFDCTTCHDPHGKIRLESRTDLCLKCHNNSSPTMAWHSSTHAAFGVACADCHNPHPNSFVQQVVAIQHTNIDRPRRSPMSVSEPHVCYRCHADVYAQNSMPSHHPIKEGKMVCSDCHDAHGQTEGNLKEPTVNMVCYRCHAEKQGPFAYEHPPVTENCAICHNPHGTVANNLLHQPATFLCLRCHTGHRTSPLGPNHSGLLGDVGTSPVLQAAFYTDCTQCHSQIHGSDLPSPHVPHAFFR
jgi:DmsE family decaheme c-type cytochrome